MIFCERSRTTGGCSRRPIVAWSLLGGPGPVTFEAPSSATTTAAFPGAGVYELRLSADDGQLTTTDTVRVTLLAEPPPSLDVEDAVVTEGDQGLTGAGVPLRLSKPWPAPVTVDFVTGDRTALRPCDYSRRYGSVTFAPGETERSVLLPVVGDRAPEGDEELSVLLGNAEGAVLARGEATVRVLDDDADLNRPPSPHAGRSPADGATAVATPRLSWVSSELEIKRSGYSKHLAGGAVLTGGGAMVKGTAELARDVLGMPVKIGIPTGFSGGLVREIDNPAYSTAVGLVYYGLKYRTQNAPAATGGGRRERSLKGIAGRMRDWFDQL